MACTLILRNRRHAIRQHSESERAWRDICEGLAFLWYHCNGSGVQLQVWRVRIFRECLNLSDDSKQERHQGTGMTSWKITWSFARRRRQLGASEPAQGGVFQSGDQGHGESKPTPKRWLCYG
jgi:hypothetical protein